MAAKKPNGKVQMTVAEAQVAFGEIQARISESQAERDQLEAQRASLAHDPTAFARTFSKATELDAEVARLRLLLGNAQDELTQAEEQEAAAAAEIRRGLIREWADKSIGVYNTLDFAAEALVKAIEQIEQHQIEGRKLGLKVIGELVIIAPAAMKAAGIGKFVKLESPVSQQRASASAGAFYDPENPKPQDRISKPPVEHKIWPSPETPWERHMRNAAVREQERNKRAANPPGLGREVTMAIRYRLCAHCDGNGGSCLWCHEGLVAVDVHADEVDDEDVDLVPCPVCDGTGTSEDGTPCEACDGSGKVAAEEPDIEESEQASRKGATRIMASATRTLDLINLRAKLIAHEKKISMSAAMIEVLESDPALYRDYLDQREQACLTQGSKRAFLSEMQVYFARENRGTQPDRRQIIAPVRP